MAYLKKNIFLIFMWNFLDGVGYTKCWSHSSDIGGLVSGRRGGGGRCFSCWLKWRRKIRALFTFAKPNAMGFFVWLTNWLACGGVGSQQTSKFPCLATSDSLEHFFLICIYFFFSFSLFFNFFVVYVKLFLAEEKKLNLFS